MLRRSAQRLLNQALKSAMAASASNGVAHTCPHVLPAASPICAGKEQLSSISRAFSARAFSSSPTADTLSILRAELAHEKDTYEPLEEALKGPPAPFKLEDIKGASELVLHRAFKGEDISVVAAITPNSFPEEDDEEDGEEESPAEPVSVTVTVTKNPDKPKLEFQLSFDNGQWIISHVGYDVLGEDYEGMVYDGPAFENLDPKLQESFYNYLEERGVNSDLGYFLQAGIDHKEQLEYQGWLENVAKFVSYK